MLKVIKLIARLQSLCFFFLIFFFNVYLFLRQRETEHERGRGRERETQNLKQAPGSELSAQSPMWGSNSQTVSQSWMFKKIFFSTFIYFWDRERQSMNGGGAERGRHRIGNRLQALSHQPRARRGARTHGPRDRDLAEVGRSTDCATQAPLICIHFYIMLDRPFCVLSDLHK